MPMTFITGPHDFDGLAPGTYRFAVTRVGQTTELVKD